MSVLLDIGDSIAGEKLFYCFGVVPPSANQKEGRFVGKLTRNGYARVSKRFRRSTTGQPQVIPEIRCETASFVCDKFQRKQKKQTCGNHTCWTGRLSGNAEATIEVPNQN